MSALTTEYQGIYFITLTCWKSLNLFEISGSHNSVYRWFDHLKSQGHFILGFTIMPNHLHLLVSLANKQGKFINSIVGNGKTYIRYEILKALKASGNHAILSQLKNNVKTKNKLRSKGYEIFQPSFHWRQCKSERFVKRKLEYMHNNPCNNKWHLADQPNSYLHSTSRFYYENSQGIYEVCHYRDLDYADLIKPMIQDERTIRRQSPRDGRLCGENNINGDHLNMSAM
jgi:REP element-mobilizing transposase RayT